MPRAQFVETVTLPLGPGGSLIPVAGIGTTPLAVNPDGSEGQQAAAYAGRTGNTLASSLATDSTGTVSYWLDDGDYDIHFQDQQNPPRVQAYVRGFSAGVAAASSGATPSSAAIGDYKFSQQAGDHGGPTNGVYDWLLVVSDSVDSLGRKALQSVYGNLWVQLGSPTVDGQGYFRLPNVSGRSLVAVGAALGLTARALGAMSGSEKVGLVDANNGPHGHGITEPNNGTGHAHTTVESNHSHGYESGYAVAVAQNGFDEPAGGAAATAGAYPFIYPNGASIGNSYGTGGATTGLGISAHTTDITINSDGQGTPHENMAPFYGANLFIKS
jgi:microcystin-dependent protein